MKYIFRIIPVIWMFSAVPDMVKAQDNCAGAIINAKTLYEQGRLGDAISELKPCLTQSLDKSNLWQGYRLLTLSYLALNDPVNARTSAESMLEINPLYTPSLLKDPRDFINLVNSITVIPKFSLGGSVAGGLNNTYVDVTGVYNVSDFTKTYTNKTGYQFGLLLGYNLTRNLELDLNIYSSIKNYGISYTTNNYQVKINEKLSYLEVPLMCTYNAGKGRIRPYISLGAYEGFLLNASSDFSSTYLPDGKQFSDNHVSSTDRRNKTSYGLLGGIGLRYKLGSTGHLFIDFRYTYGLANIVNTNARYADENLSFKYYYLDDDIKLSNGLITLGYVRYINYKVIRDK